MIIKYLNNLKKIQQKNIPATLSITEPYVGSSGLLWFCCKDMLFFSANLRFHTFDCWFTVIRHTNFFKVNTDHPGRSVKITHGRNLFFSFVASYFCCVVIFLSLCCIFYLKQIYLYKKSSIKRWWENSMKKKMVFVLIL